MKSQIFAWVFVVMTVILYYMTGDDMNSGRLYIKDENEYLPGKRVRKNPDGTYVYKKKTKGYMPEDSNYNSPEWKKLSRWFCYSKPFFEIRFRAWWIQRFAQMLFWGYVSIFIIGEIIIFIYPKERGHFILFQYYYCIMWNCFMLIFYLCIGIYLKVKRYRDRMQKNKN